MSIEVINTGTTPNDGTGDSLRSSFIKCNNNFSYLDSIIGGNNNIVANTLTANSATVSGNVFFGQALNFVPLNANLQYAGTANAYVRMIAQNKSALSNATTDFVVTADNGTNSNTFVDLGISSSGYDTTSRSLIKANDGFLIVSGNTTTGGGNLSLVTLTEKDVIIATNGAATTNEVARFKHNVGLQIVANTVATATNTGALQVAGGASVQGNLYVGSGLTSAGGTITTGEYVGSFANGVAIDYTTGTGRISVGTNSGLTVFTNGVASTTLMSLSNIGDLAAAGNITATGNITADNLLMPESASSIVGTGSGFGLDLVRVIRYNVGNQLGTNTTSVTANLNTTAASRTRLVFDINANVTVTVGGSVTAGVEKQLAFRNVAGATANIILPTAYNNKGSNVIPVASNTTTFVWLYSTDTTTANIFATVINN